MSAPILLASSSPRRKDFLSQFSIPFLSVTPNIDETHRSAETSAIYLDRIVTDKVNAMMGHPYVAQCSAVLAADTIICLDDEIIQKPENRSHAQQILSQLSGRSHQVITRFELARISQGLLTERHAESSVSEVKFRQLSVPEIQAYVATGEGEDKAAGYAIQGIGACLIEEIHGSYPAIVGLPIEKVVQAMFDFGLLTNLVGNARQ